jgi:hypothetical protein
MDAKNKVLESVGAQFAGRTYKFQKNVEKYGIEVAKSIEAGHIKEVKKPFRIGSYSKTQKK